MQKETETEEIIVFFVTILSLVAFRLGGGRAPPLATPVLPRMAYSYYTTVCKALKLPRAKTKNRGVGTQTTLSC